MCHSFDVFVSKKDRFCIWIIWISSTFINLRTNEIKIINFTLKKEEFFYKQDFFRTQIVVQLQWNSSDRLDSKTMQDNKQSKQNSGAVFSSFPLNIHHSG